MRLQTLRVNCDDYCSDCGRCHDFASRAINWGEIAPKCQIGSLDDNDLMVECQGGHSDYD